MKDFQHTIPMLPWRVVVGCKGEGCKQGRWPCPTPDACFLAEDEPTSCHDDGAFVMLGRVIVAALVAAALGFAFWPA